MDKLIIKNGLFLVGKVKELKQEIKKLPPRQTLTDYVRKNLN